MYVRDFLSNLTTERILFGFSLLAKLIHEEGSYCVASGNIDTGRVHARSTTASSGARSLFACPCEAGASRQLYI